MRPCVCDHCYVCWKWHHDKEWRLLCGGPSETAIPESVLAHGPNSIITEVFQLKPLSATVTISTVNRLNSCEYLLKRTEFKPGCRGWRCRHDCVKKLPAVPGEYCQSCPEYKDSGEVF